MANDLKLRIHSQDPRLKRHINHDSESARYKLPTRHLSLVDVDWLMHIPTMNQGSTGKCTAEAATEILASDPFWDTLPANVQKELGDVFSDTFYSAEETLDGDGPYPPQDNGSSGLTSAKVAKNEKLISGYQHTFTAEDALKGLQISPFSWGTLWKTGMDNVDTTTGQVTYTGTTRGGHELCGKKLDVKNERLWCHQSWGQWGYQNSGLFWISFTDFEKSLADQGDVTFFTPLNQPAPTPTPPGPTPTPAPGNPDLALVSAMDPWAATIISRITKSGRAKLAYENWKQLKGY